MFESGPSKVKQFYKIHYPYYAKIVKLVYPKATQFSASPNTLRIKK